MAPGLSCCSCQRMCCDGLDAMIGDINSHKFQIDIGRRDRPTFHNSYSSPNRKPATKNTKQQQGTKKTQIYYNFPLIVKKLTFCYNAELKFDDLNGFLRFQAPAFIALGLIGPAGREGTHFPIFEAANTH